MTQRSVRFGSFTMGAVLFLGVPLHAEREEEQEEVVTRTFVDLRDRLKVGDRIYVTDSTGRFVRGELQEFFVETPALALEKPEQRIVDSRGEDAWKKLESTLIVNEGNTRRIEVEVPDSLANGTLIGFAVGATPGLLWLAFGESEGSAYGGYMGAFWGGIGAAIGALTDRATKSCQPIYSVPEGGSSIQIRWSPILSRERKGVSFNVAF